MHTVEITAANETDINAALPELLRAGDEVIFITLHRYLGLL